MSTSTKSKKTKYALDATLRVDQGKGASRRLRRLQDQFPAIIYGGKEEPTLLSLDHKKVMHALEDPGFYSHLLTLHIDGKPQQVVLKSIQRQHYKKGVLHMDFLRVKPTDIIVMRVPLHFLGQEDSPGVKDGGGVMSHNLMDIEVRCEAQKLPEFIEVDVSKMELDQSLHISHLKFPKGVESVALAHGPEHDHPVVSVHLPRVAVEEESAAPEESAEVPAIEVKPESTTGAATPAAGGKDKEKAKDKKGK